MFCHAANDDAKNRIMLAAEDATVALDDLITAMASALPENLRSDFDAVVSGFNGRIALVQEMTLQAVCPHCVAVKAAQEAAGA